MKNKLSDLNNHLFAQLERLSDEDVKGDDLKLELLRAKGVAGISREIITNAQLALDAEQFRVENGLRGPLPDMLENKPHA